MACCRASYVTVVRDGATMQVSAENLVTDDVVLLAEGDRVSADLRLDRVHALAVDTSALTGESVPEHPTEGEHVYGGCFVVEGAQLKPRSSLPGDAPGLPT